MQREILFGSAFLGMIVLVAAIIAALLDAQLWAILLLLVVAVTIWTFFTFAVVRDRRRLRADLVRVRSLVGESSERVAILSHEIRTPLALIKGASDLLLEQSPGPLNAQQARFMATIGRNSESLVQLAEDLLTQARIEAGMFALHLKRTDLRRLCRSTVEELRDIHPVIIELDVSGAPPRLWVDAGLIRQALTNLVNNAVKASPEASSINVRVANTGGDVVSLSVSDNGSGMGDQERQRLFERFASGHPLRDGTGLGMVITRQIARLHGGDLYVDTVAGRGTTIVMTLPIRGDDEDGRTEGISSARR